MPNFVPRKRKHKVLQRQKDQKLKHGGKRHDVADTNATEIVPAATATELERQEKKGEITAGIRSEQPQMGSKKRKRLDKYIDKKLRKEETLELIKKLANSKVDTGLLRSSREFGATKTTKREELTRALRETEAGINIDRNREILFESSGSESETASRPDEDSSEKSAAVSQPKIVVGSGLKRPIANGTDGNPIIKKRRRAPKSMIPKPALLSDSEHDSIATDEGSWSGFSNSGSSRDADDLTALSADSSDSHPADGSGTDTEMSHDSANDEANTDLKARFSAFKAWATSQINEAVGFTPTSEQSSNVRDAQNSNESKRLEYKAKPPEVEPLPPELAINNFKSDRKAYSVAVNRADEVQARRMELPIIGEEQRIMEAIHNNSTVVICGETGSGKTTQVPQFLYESGYGSKNGQTPGMIGITQPRRVAAVSMAARVSHEVGEAHATKVAHQVRFDTSVSRDTSIKFMTDGILLREIAKDFSLPRYSAIIVDEAHERSANTDILIGLMSRIVDLRESMHKEDSKVAPLKLIIMSATLRVQDFIGNKQLFKNRVPPLLQIEGRQHPVTVHFARRTQPGYVEQMFQKVCRGHRRLPPGGMLVFLTAQDEISTLVQRLNKELVRPQRDELIIERDSDDSSGDEDGENFGVEDLQSSSRVPNVHVLPLYSQLPTNEQLRIFEPPPDGARMIIVATNVAETSLTIPGIRYVFDCGRAKEKKYDDLSAVQSFEIGWISKASAQQRTGRAGRTGPGHCYRLYSSAVYERDFEEHAVPEILRMPVEGVVLQLKSMELHNVVNFPFPSAPDRQGLARAERLLTHLGGLTAEGRITQTGRDMTVYPIAPRYAKMLTIGHQFNCMALTIVLVAALATPNIFLPQNHFTANHTEPDTGVDVDAQERNLQQTSDYNHAHHLLSKLSRTADALKALKTLQVYLKANDKAQYCKQYFLAAKQMQEASNLVSQLTSIIQKHVPLHLSTGTPQLSTPSKDQISALQQFTAAGFLDQIAILASAHPSPPYVGRTSKRAIDVPYLPLHSIHHERLNADSDVHDIAVYVHPSSVLAHTAVKEMPKYVIYSHLQRSQAKTVEGGKRPRTRMHPLVTVTEKAILALAQGTTLLQWGKPLSILEEKVGEKGRTRTCIVQPNLVGEKGTMGWPLPAQKVVQTKNARGEWVVE